MHPRILSSAWWRVTFVVLLGLLQPDASVGQERTQLTGEISIARLVDLASQQANIDTRYDPSLLRDRATTIRSNDGLTSSELWQLMQSALLGSGFTTIAEPGMSGLVVVTAEAAKSLARVEPGIDLATVDAGFATVLYRTRVARAGQLATSISPILSPKIGQVVEIDGQPMLLISDTTARLRQALSMLATIDAEMVTPQIARIPAVNIDAASLATVVLQASRTEETVRGMARNGTVIASSTGDALLVIAPDAELAEWRRLIKEFDVPPALSRQTYVVEGFDLNVLATALENLVRIERPRGSGDAWHIASDGLTQSIIVTATAVEHALIRDQLERLEDLPEEARHSTRVFKIRHRDVNEIFDVLTDLLDAGFLASDAMAAAGTTEGDASGETRQTASRSATGAEMSLNVDPLTSSIIAMGAPRLLDRIESLITEIDVRQPQVMLEVMVVSLDDSRLRDLGIELEKVEISGASVFNLRSLFGIASGDIAEPTVGRGNGLTGIVLTPGDYSVVIRALESVNDGRTLVMPKVLVNNNEKAILDSVRQEPVQSTNASDTVATTSFSGFQDAGTQVELEPQIAEGDHVLLRYNVRLSSFVGESATPSLPPPRLESAIESVVTVPDGHTIVLGGLEQRTESEAESYIPGIGQIPLIGELFKSRSRTDAVSRFFVFVRATILRHDNFEDLRYLSEVERVQSGLASDWPAVHPRIIR